MGRVLKFGGTSVATTSHIKNIASYIKEQGDDEIVVVVSAMGKYTDELIKLASDITIDIDKRELDMLLATGEQQTIALLTIALKEVGVNAISYTGAQAGVITTDDHSKGIIKDVNISRVRESLDQGLVVVVAGFQGVTESGNISTLGRGGSDTSCVALAAKLGFDAEIYTDVDGIYTVDPRVFKDAKKLDKISYEEMMEMASLGAGVIETRSVELAKKYNVPLYIARSLSEKGSGTMIENGYLFEDKPITGLSIKKDIVMVTLEDVTCDIAVVSNVFKLVSEQNISVDMINQNVDKDGN